MAYLDLDHLSKAYGTTWAVRDVTLGIEQGEVVCLLGPSGCGKTTTLNMIAGFIPPTSGQISLEGRALQHIPPNRRDTLMVFQNYALFPHMTVWQNVAFGLEMRRVPKHELKQRVAEGLELVGLGALAERYPRQLSGGQQQRVALARALVTRPKVLLLDEPLSNLDAKLRQEMRREIRRIQQATRITTVFVTHDQEEALTISDRITVMNAGAVEQVGTAIEIYEHPKTMFVATFIGKANIIDAEVRAVETGRVIVCGPGGLTYYARTDLECATGEPVALVVRPERMRLSSERTGAANRLTAEVTSVLYLGSALHITLDAGSHAGPLEVHQPMADAMHTPRPGDRVVVEWEAGDACVVKR